MQRGEAICDAMRCDAMQCDKMNDGVCRSFEVAQNYTTIAFPFPFQFLPRAVRLSTLLSIILKKKYQLNSFSRNI